MDETIRLRYPNYFEEFECIGKRCTDTCCAGWEIEVDKVTFEEYDGVSDDREIKEELKKNVRRNLKVIDENVDYAKISLNDEKRCPFLDGDNYCKIYKELGENYLGNVCTSFPRILNKVDDVYEVSLDISCPHAAEMILKKDEIFFEEKEKSLGKHIVWNKVDTDEKFNWLPIKYFIEIRNKSIEIIKNKKISLDDRIINLGYFIKDVEEAYEIDGENIKEYIEKYEFIKYEIENNGKIDSAEFFKVIIEFLNIEDNINNKFIKNKSKEILENKEDIKEIFNDKLLENYLVNYMFSSLFPFSEIESIFDGFVMIIVRYLLFKKYKCESEEDNILVMQKLSKILNHNKNYTSEILNYVKDNELDNLKLTQYLKKPFY
ncbi:MAG: flagellin lysine-N-methylase [Clostridium sp.]|uniref:flagellin lysine-N-methylase n=1 Tax=Clostridium sp. TaxID=1506 RepID=UPI003EE58413